MSPEHVEHFDRLAATDTVGSESTVLLEVDECPDGGRAEDAVRTSTVESDVVQCPLQVPDVVTTQLGCFEEQCAVPKTVASLDDGQPRLLVTHTVDVESTSILETPNGVNGGRAKFACLGTSRCIPGGTEAAL